MSYTEEVDQFADAIEKSLETIHTKESFKNAKSQFLNQIWEDIEYDVIQNMGETLRSLVINMSEKAVTEIIEGRDDQMRRYLKLDFYTGREHEASVIHGTLFETNGIALRKKMAQAHPELIQNERIKDLESQLEYLVAEIAKRDKIANELREYS